MKCGNIVSTVYGWKCEKCDVEGRTTNETWNKQRECASMREETWINFYNKLDGTFLGGYTEIGTFQGELEATLEFKANDNHINVTDVEVRYEKMKVV